MKILKLLTLTVFFCAYNLTVSANEATFETITDALNCNEIDRKAVTKLTITGTISGDDYSDESEWSKFRTLNQTFPNLSEIEILTDQNIPDLDDHTFWRGLFYCNQHSPNNTNFWLKSFSAPNVKRIGSGAFVECVGLTKVDFKNVITVGSNSFRYCVNLPQVDFPNLTTIESFSFWGCFSFTSLDFPKVSTVSAAAFGKCSTLTSITFGAGFETPTEIFLLGLDIFPEISSENIDLCLGENVLPLPDLVANTWNGYTWKTINNDCYISVKCRAIATHLTIFPNPTSSEFTLSFELEKSGNLQILLCDILGSELLEVYTGFAPVGTFSKTVNTEHLPRGIYFLHISIDGNSRVEKVVVE